MTKPELVFASTRHHRARLLKYYLRQPCAPSFVISRMLRPQQTHFLLFPQILFILVCKLAGNPRVTPQVFTSGPKPCSGNNFTFNFDGLIRSQKWPPPNVNAFIAQLVNASHKYREVTDSNPVEAWLFQASMRNCLNCVHNRDDHS